jgi:hypothetical protein
MQELEPILQIARQRFAALIRKSIGDRFSVEVELVMELSSTDPRLPIVMLMLQDELQKKSWGLTRSDGAGKYLDVKPLSGRFSEKKPLVSPTAEEPNGQKGPEKAST